MTHAAPHILKIAEHLFGQMRAFSVSSKYAKWDRDKLEGLILPRLSLLEFLLTALEQIDQQGTREAIGRGTPIIYNTHSWPVGAPVAGWYDVDGAIPLATHIHSIFLSWHLQLGQNADAMCGKVMRAALWVLNSTGSYESALRYVLDLQQFGTVINETTTACVLETLLGIRRRVPDDGHIVERCVTTPGDHDWRFAKLGDLDLDGPVIRADLHDEFHWLLERATSEIDIMVASPTYDDWFINRLRLLPLLNVVQRMFRKYELEDALPYVGTITQIEEIRADSGGAAGLLPFQADRFMSFAFVADYTMSHVAITGLKTTTPDWFDRLEERAAVPARLWHLVSEDGLAEGGLPEGWARFSAVCVPIVSPLLFDEELPALRRSTGFEPQDVRECATFAQLLSGVVGADRDLLENAALQILCIKQASAWPFRPATDSKQSSGGADAEQANYLAMLEATLAKFNRDYANIAGEYLPRQALEAMQRILLWSDGDVEPELRKLYINTCIDEVNSMFQAVFAMDQPCTEPPLKLLTRLIHLYPYFDGAWLERAVRLDQAGDTPSALDAMLEAITLQPNEHLRWHSLAVILRRIGSEPEALIAAILSKAIKGKG